MRFAYKIIATVLYFVITVIRTGGHLAQVKMCILDTPAQCICYNPDGTMLAVGLGGGLSSDPGEWSDRGDIQARYPGLEGKTCEDMKTKEQARNYKVDGRFPMLPCVVTT